MKGQEHLDCPEGAGDAATAMKGQEHLDCPEGAGDAATCHVGRFGQGREG